MGDSYEEELEELLKALQEKDEEIARLTQEKESLSRRKGGRDFSDDAAVASEITGYIAEIEELKGVNEQDKIELEKLREQLADVNARYSIMSHDKTEVDTRVKTQAARITELERELVNASSRSKVAGQQSQDVAKIRSDANKEARRLLDQIDSLEEHNKKLTETVTQLEADKSLMEEVIRKLDDERDLLQSHRDNADLTKDELSARVQELEEIVEQVQEELQVSREAEIEWKNRVTTLQEEFESKNNELVDQLQKKNDADVRVGKKSFSKVDMLLHGDDIDSDSALLIEQLQNELQIVSAEKEKLAEHVVFTDNNIKKLVNDRIVAEKEKIRMLEKNVESLKSRLSEESSRAASLEKEKAVFMSDVDELSNWKEVYEAGHGMQALARNQKRLKDHNRRLEKAIEQNNSKIGALMDANGILAQAFDKLKEESGKDPSFMYPEYLLQQALLSDKARLNAQIYELDEQVLSLETENVRLRKALKSQAGVLGEQGLNNLRDSNVDLLLEERSSSLIKENRKLRDDVKVLSLQLQHYERESPTAPVQVEIDTSDRGASSSDIRDIREDMQKLLTIVRQMMTSSPANVDPEQFSSILLSHNEALLKEIHGLRKTQQQVSYRPSSPGESTPHKTQDRESSTVDRRDGKQTQQDMSQTVPSGLTPSYKLPPSGIRGTNGPLVAQAPSVMHPSISVTNPFQTPGVDHTVSAFPSRGPATPFGKVLLSKNINQLNLPPEDWAQDVKELNAQFVECLEQLYEREEQLEDQKKVIASFEDHLISVKQQNAVLYRDYTKKMSAWGKRETEYKSETEKLRVENEDIKLKLKRFNELIDLKRKDDPESLESKLNELTRKLSIYEVNENVLSRKFIAQSEHLATEQEIRKKLEVDMTELESILKKRILFLEQYKAAAGARLAVLQSKLDASVPQNDFSVIQKELEYLREEHINALQREVDARVAALSGQERIQELRQLRLHVVKLESDLKGMTSNSHSIAAQLEKQKELTKTAVSSAKIPNDLATLVGEVAQYRGDAAKFEVLLVASNRKVDLLQAEVERYANEIDKLTSAKSEVDSKIEVLAKNEAIARKELADLKIKYENGLSRDEAEVLRSKTSKLERELDESKRESSRLKDLADIASRQAQSLGFFRQDQMNEIKELRDYCAKLESRGDDDILIGRLQRQLMSTKTSYTAFVRKYQLLRGNMRQRELAIRMLEARLDQREEAVFRLQENHRLEISALKKALRAVSNIPDDDGVPQPGRTNSSGLNHTISSKLKEVSSKVSQLSSLAENAVSRKVDKERECRKLLDQLDDLAAEKEILEQRCLDLDTVCKGQSQRQLLASRINSLYEELGQSKQANMKNQRQIQLMKKEKRHLESVIAAIEADVEGLEEMKVQSEIKGFLPPIQDESTIAVATSPKLEEEIDNFFRKSAVGQLKPDADVLAIKKRITFEDDGEVDTNDALVKNVNDLKSQVVAANREASSFKTQVDQLRSQMKTLEAALLEQRNQLAYYEKTLNSEGLPVLTGSSSKSTPSRRSRRMPIEDQEKLQEAASATISSLRFLLDEKNRLIEKYREKIEELQTERSRVKSRADKAADDLLDRLNEETGGNISTRKVVIDEEVRAMNQKLLDQIEQADHIIADKSQMIAQLEEKLLVQSNQRERAEVRCGESIKELESMKADMIKLVNQLQLSEERFKAMMPKASSVAGVVTAESEKLVKDLKKIIKTKDDKIKGYREIVLRLKEEFIKSEEQKEVMLMSMKGKDARSDDNAAGMTADDKRQLLAQVTMLRNGLQEAKDDLEKARMAREKTNKARQAALADVSKLQEQIGTLQSQAALLEEAKEKFKKDLEESRRKEVRLRDKLKDIMEVGMVKDGENDLKSLQADRDNLQREVDVLRAQNSALRRGEKIDEISLDRPSSPDRDRGKGHILGRGQVTEGLEDVRQQLHLKWENEKKLEKKLETLKKRLDEKIEENEELQNQLKRARDTMQGAIHSKEDLQKKFTQVSKQSKDSKKLSVEEAASLDEALSKLFLIEEENASLKRKVEVELHNEIVSLRQQLHNSRLEVQELESELKESADRRFKAEQGPRSLRDSEDRFLHEEKLKEDIAASKRQRLELEAALLDRDARAMEHKFDLLANDQEITRLRRRIRELESFRVPTREGEHERSRVAWGPAAETGAIGGKRERELEVAVETLKKVIDQLKADNSRLRHESSQANVGETKDKKVAIEKKRADKLQEDIVILQAKVRSFDELTLKLTQSKQQIAQLRKQLKSREDEGLGKEEIVGQIKVEKEALQRKLSTAESRIQQLELSLQQTNARLIQSTTEKARDENIVEIENLRRQVEILKRQITEKDKPVSSGVVPSSSELTKLLEENRRLKKELSAFDMDFFDEIENLKYEHAEAVRKLRTYQRSYGDIA